MSKEQLPKNQFIIAAAGSGKTWYLVDEALHDENKNILFTTFTVENYEQIVSYFIEKNGSVPANVTVLTWYSFLIRHGVRPYQNLLTDCPRVKSIYFEDLPPHARYAKKANTNEYYFTTTGLIYRDRVSEFVCHCDDESGSFIASRIEGIFDSIYIDEVQDLAGYDLMLLELLMKSSVGVLGVGDFRQATYTTNYSRKNSKYKKAQIADWIAEKERDGVAVVNAKTDCHRCNQIICDFADTLYPELPRAISNNATKTGHDGVFFIRQSEAYQYYEQYAPTVLRDNKRSNTMGLPAINFGVSKGRSYDRVMVFPTPKMKEFLTNKDLTKLADKSRLYVAITRARYSVAFVM